MSSTAFTIDAQDGSADPTTEATYAPGMCIERRYQLVEKLGDGGMGSVWRAHDANLERDVAIKLLHGEHRASEIATRLRIEAQAAGQLTHPAIVRVYDAGETEQGDPFLVMEVLHGESLAALADRRGKLPELEAVQLLLPIAGALVAAHGAGIVHRDIKPDNILITGVDGDASARQPKLVDFGIARRRVGPEDRRLTMKGALLGSPGYMAPEQAMGRLDCDARTDVWAFSVVLYELVTGEMPFVRPTVPGSLAAILRHDPTPTAELGGDPALWAILQRGLAKDPAARWPTMAELRRALVDWASARGATLDVSGAPLSPSRPPPAPSMRPSGVRLVERSPSPPPAAPLEPANELPAVVEAPPLRAGSRGAWLALIALAASLVVSGVLCAIVR